MPNSLNYNAGSSVDTTTTKGRGRAAQDLNSPSQQFRSTFADSPPLSSGKQFFAIPKSDKKYVYLRPATDGWREIGIVSPGPKQENDKPRVDIFQLESSFRRDEGPIRAILLFG